LRVEIPDLQFNPEEPTYYKEEIIMGAPSPELVDLWLAKAFTARDVEAADAFLAPAKSAGAALVAGSGARSAKEASHA
jgi:hypothetical protein